jgi:hypothetical protein
MDPEGWVSAATSALAAAPGTIGTTVSTTLSVDAEVVYAAAFCLLSFALCCLSFLRLVGPTLLLQTHSPTLAKAVKRATDLRVPDMLPFAMVALFAGVWYKDAVVWFGRAMGLRQVLTQAHRYVTW